MPSSMPVFTTPLTKLFKINYPIMLAGMNAAAGPKLAAAVTNAGWSKYSVIDHNESIDNLKRELEDSNAPFGVDLLIPQVGGSARKTNYDYTKGQLPELTEVPIKNKVALFVCGIGVPPKDMVEKLHAAGIPVMNMVGHPKHVKRALKQGVDIICAQGGEGGGHTGDIPFSILIPACVDACRGAKSPLTSEPVVVVAAGGIADGRGLAAALSYGAAGVWVGTRFVASEEAEAPQIHKDYIVNAGFDDTVRSVIYTGRPLNLYRTPFVAEWEEQRQDEIRGLTSQGRPPVAVELERYPEKSISSRGYPMGKVAGIIKDIKPAKQIVDEMVLTAAHSLNQASVYIITDRAKL